ncbi:phosphatase PAP2 family protein [Rhodococcus sp. 077-4]|uniref:phosphatase PAP2 family protein n=1 Tax=Rhodococcus sp. 077-4 TaxID=2789271 RepID=UPI0039F5DDA6
MGFDSVILDWMVEHRVDWLTAVFWIVTTVGNTVSMFLLSAVAVVALLRVGRRVDALVIAGSMLTGWGVMNALKFAFARERPPIPERLVEISSHSFPSGHAMMSMLLATVAIAVMVRSPHPWLHRPVLLVLPVVAALLIGFSRIYLGAHWTTDVLAGWVFGALWGLAWICAEKAISGRSPSAGR